MEVYTIQISQWRKAKAAGIPFVDTTVKTGTSIFAPTWPMVVGVKAGSITEAEYTEQYIALMRERFNQRPEEWAVFCKQEKVAIACFCPSGCFCHRYILKDLLAKYCNRYNIPFEYKGELA